MSTDLIQAMAEVVGFIRQRIEDGADADSHWDICQATAERFELWEDDAFPGWLSLVVEGEMRDAGL